MGRYLISMKLKVFLLVLPALVSADGFSAGTGPEETKVYNLEYIKDAAVDIDGIDSEAPWKRVQKESGLSFPWKHSPAPATSFRAFYSDEYVFFFFEAVDADLVITSGPGEQSVEQGDRVELFFSAGSNMDRYFCLEIDPAGKVLDYKASFYRKFDPAWDLGGLITAARLVPGGYEVEAAVPARWFRDSGISSMEKGSSFSIGIYRAEFSHSASGAPTEEWISWKNPGTVEPDFHVPSSLGIFILGPGKNIDQQVF